MIRPLLRQSFHWQWLIFSLLLEPAVFAFAAAAGGAVQALKTTPLMTFEEGLDATSKASQAGYQPPGG